SHSKIDIGRRTVNASFVILIRSSKLLRFLFRLLRWARDYYFAYSHYSSDYYSDYASDEPFVFSTY
ncbi:MAG: hypothetical protein LW772_08330, partial [Bacteroidetes bacterium]|nr:hypothetical protein [Bacteroidota bacterium]